MLGRNPDDVAKVLVYDIETTPNLGWTWGKWQQNVIRFERQYIILCFAYKWLGTKKVETVALPDFDLYERDRLDDYGVVAELHELFRQADVTVTHNGKGFDMKKANTRFAVHGLEALPPRKDIDTLQTARKQFGFTSNRLGDLCHALGLEAKASPGGIETWFDCMDGDEKAWRKMRRYNAQDVRCLEQVYLKFRPWMNNHPNLNIYGDRPDSCPRCGGDKLVIRGYRAAGVTMRVRYQCNKCHGYSMGRQIHDTRIKYRAI